MDTRDLVQCGSVSAEFDSEMCSLQALQKAAYEFSSRAAINILRTGSDRFSVTLVSATDEAGRIVGQFKARAAHLTLQEKINAETRTIREALVTAAMWESMPHKASPRE